MGDNPFSKGFPPTNNRKTPLGPISSRGKTGAAEFGGEEGEVFGVEFVGDVVFYGGEV